MVTLFANGGANSIGLTAASIAGGN